MSFELDCLVDRSGLINPDEPEWAVMYFNVYLHLEYTHDGCIVNALLILQN